MRTLTVTWNGKIIKSVNGLDNDKDFMEVYVNQDMSSLEQKLCRESYERQKKYFSVVFLVNSDEGTIIDMWSKEEFDIVHDHREVDMDFVPEEFLKEIEETLCIIA